MYGKLEICGYCGGAGLVHGSMYDQDGRRRYQEPPAVTCEYCNGSGSVINGSCLLPASEDDKVTR